MEALDDIHQNSRFPILAQLFSDQNKSMIIGLASEKSVLIYGEDDMLGPCFYSLNPLFYDTPFDPSVADTTYFYFGADTDILERYDIDIHVAKAGFSEFFETQTMSKNIVWEQG